MKFPAVFLLERLTQMDIKRLEILVSFYPRKGIEPSSPPLISEISFTGNFESDGGRRRWFSGFLFSLILSASLREDCFLGKIMHVQERKSGSMGKLLRTKQQK